MTATALSAGEDMLNLLAVLPDGHEPEDVLNRLEAHMAIVTPKAFGRITPSIDGDSARALHRCLHRTGWIDQACDSDLVVHAKFVEDDRLDCLGSANMTHYGLEANVELGVRIGAAVVRDLRAVLIAPEKAGCVQRSR